MDLILETIEALGFAKNLDDLQIEDQFIFTAKMNWVRPFGMLLTACTIKQFRNKYVDVPFRLEYNNPLNSGQSYAAHMGFFKAISDRIDLGKEPGEATGNDNYIPITELDLNQIHHDEIQKDGTIHMGEAIEKKSSELAKILCRDDKEMHKLIT